MEVYVGRELTENNSGKDIKWENLLQLMGKKRKTIFYCEGKSGSDSCIYFSIKENATKVTKGYFDNSDNGGLFGTNTCYPVTDVTEKDVDDFIKNPTVINKKSKSIKITLKEVK